MKQMNCELFYLLINLLVVTFPLSSARDTITINQPLLDNQTLISSDDRFALGFFTPHGSSHRYLGLWYNQISEQTILWVANRDRPLINSRGTLSISANGTLSIYEQNSYSTAVWYVDAFTLVQDVVPIVQLLSTGNLVVIAQTKSFPYSLIEWESFNYPTDTLLPGMELGKVQTEQFNIGYLWNLTSWANNTNPSSGEKKLWMGIDNYTDLYLSDTNSNKWRGGPSTGYQLELLQWNAQGNIDFSYFAYSGELPSRLVVNESGFVQLWSWENYHWNLTWYEPKNSCDNFGNCGPNTICNFQNKSICSCLPDYTNNWPNGCTPKSTLNCDYTKFVSISGIKLPDPTTSDIRPGLNFSTCDGLCMADCSCTAFTLFDYQCIIWLGDLLDISTYGSTGQNLYVRVSRDYKDPPNTSHTLSNGYEDPPNRHGNMIKFAAIIVSAIFGISLLACIGCVYCRGKNIEHGTDGENELELPLVDFEIVAIATDNFSAENKLGEGGFGPVYKGKFEEGQEIAVKRLSKSSHQGVDEFKNEVKLIAKLQHRNLVRLLGCCIQREERMLIYEYLPNKSLDAFLFGKEGDAILDWKTRYSIIMGIARGVLYLHHDSRLQIIHRDLKASNILLDKDMNPKISDFGMARIFGGDETDFNTRKIVGTLDNITVNQPLFDNETLVSSNGRFALGFFTPAGNSNRRYLGLWYKNVPEQTILWVANRDDPLINSKGTLSISANETLAIYDQNSSIVWSAVGFILGDITRTIVRLLDTGNLVVIGHYKNNPDSYDWESFNHPTDTLLPGMKLGVRFDFGYNWSLTSWASNTDPSSGQQTLWMGINGYPELYLSDKNILKWRSGPWDGDLYSRIAYKPIYFNATTSQEEISLLYVEDDDVSSISRLVVSDTGFVQLWAWKNNHWNLSWYEPKNPCEKFGNCGPNTMCDFQNKPICSCLPGFSHYSPNGCIRKSPLKCDNTNRFVSISGIKLPDPSTVIIHKDLSYSDCQVLCLSSCSCSAFTTDYGHQCMIWSANLSDITLHSGAGQKLYISVADHDLSNGIIDSSNRQRNKIILIAITVSVILAILPLACVGCFFCRGKKEKHENDGENELELPLVDFKIIAAATDNFSTENKLGEGGFGPVYKGKLEKDQVIAVKRLSRSSQQGVDEFKNEIKLIAKLQHRNLVRLLSCCIQREERMLIYEYLPNKSLDAFLFGKEGDAFLDWKTRYSIMMGIARGVLYLHHDSRLRIIHRDLKASNILLDKDMNPKISDFGMARIFGGDEADFNTRKVVGTFGYMSPEYVLHGIFSMKSDIFSFGVLVLEIISGKKNRGVYAFSTHLNLLSHVWDLWKESDSLRLVDEKIEHNANANEIIKCIKIGLLCVQERPEDRPLMPTIIEMFNKDITSLPEPNPPGFVTRFAPLDIIDVQEQFSINNVSITSLGGR